jgi:ribonuclease BN (tRNA processing enzyme)
LVSVAEGADLLLCEASFEEGPANPPGLHLTGRQAGEHAAAAGVGRLLVTHVPAWVDAEAQLADARTAFAAAELVAPGAVFDI